MGTDSNVHALHASAAMTLDTYADLFDDDLNGVADAVGTLWEKCAQNVPRAPIRRP